MLSLKGRQDGFRLLLPKEFIPEHINDKYAKILREQRGFINRPIDFLNETIQRVEVLGFSNAAVSQQQPNRGTPMIDDSRYEQNNFMHSAAEAFYRSAANPVTLIDKTMNVTFKHVLGYLNYFILFESFMYHYSRDTKSKELPKRLSLDLMNEKGSVYCKIILENPIIDGIDMLTFDYTQPVAQSQTFQVIFKYTNFDYQFIEAESSNWNGEVE